MYGGRSDDLEYMQEVLKTAERVGDKAYIQRLKNQIEEIKKRQTQPTKPTLATSKRIAKKEEPLKTSEAKTVGKLGDRCTPIVNRGVPGSCETGTVCWSGVNRCCSRHASGEFYDCGEAGISPIKGSPVPSPIKGSPVPSPIKGSPSSPVPSPIKGSLSSPVPSPITMGPRAPPSSSVPTSPSTPTPIHITDGKMTASPTTITPATMTPTTMTASPTTMIPTTMTPTTMTPMLATASEKKVIGDYFNLKMSILKNIQELQKLKIQKDKLLNVVGYTPQLVFHNKQTTMDDCIRDESGKVLQC